MLGKIKVWYFKKIAARMIKKHGSEKVNKLALIKKPMKEWKVAFITTAGVHLLNDKPFDVDGGDWGVRFIPSDTKTSDLMITHTHYDTTSADKDVNCVFPISSLQQLSDKKIIGELAPTFYGMMGYIPRVDKLLNESIPKILEKLKEEKVDVVLLSPG
ncbi:glycine/sarcosine/betaine reductase selenoprotein B family protein [Salipaludibacillus daqingensis]|uniref:glycine/sarcosine/betaine reductase selenoprotein B family protein n=1 Tax=Salipaludibacillus daqingensis TaxID=3041001 RepID=UPI00247523CC|nr:glycine/sarcosine/betaine reductase selenoprotein B family protein [Salipaludibacillus daqingensis]